MLYFAAQTSRLCDNIFRHITARHPRYDHLVETDIPFYENFLKTKRKDRASILLWHKRELSIAVPPLGLAQSTLSINGQYLFL